jgi:hypothetical protein
MAGRHRRGGRVTPKGTRPRSFDAGTVNRDRASDGPDLLADVGRRLASGKPLDLLAEVSGLLAALDPRADDPLERARGGRRTGPTIDELTRSFADVDRVETSAMLAGIAQMAADDLVRARARRALAARNHALPMWLVRLGETTAYRAVEMVHVLGDGDNIIVGTRLPDGHELSLVVYIDHNLGTVVRDAFVVPEPIAHLVEFMQAKNDDPDVLWRDITPADARARIAEAIDTGAMTFPPFETDSWPACRPLLEWVNRLLPQGGSGYVRPKWDEEGIEALTDRFFGSPFGSELDDHEHRQLLESILWFATDYGPGDPLRWSPTAVEILLLDWVPRKIVADAAFLSLVPDLLRAFVTFCHTERQVRSELTDQTLEAVDGYESEYQRIIRSPRPQGPAALMAAMGVLDPDGPWDLGVADEEELDYETMALGWLSDAVGGRDILEALDDMPLPDEEFSWAGIDADVHGRVGEVLALCDRCCDEMLDVEYRTACRRFLAQGANGDPNVFRRKARPGGAAAAVCWIVGKANELFTPSGGGMLVKELMAHFGLTQGGVSQRAETLMKAAGLDRSERYGQIDLGSPELLVSSRRRRIVARRDLLLDRSRRV